MFNWIFKKVVTLREKVAVDLAVPMKKSRFWITWMISGR